MARPSISIVPATLEHAHALGVDLRDEDAAEVWAASRHLPIESVQESIKASVVSWALLLDGTITAVFGITPADMVSGVGIVWALTANTVNKHPKTCHQVAKEILPFFLDQYPILINMVHAKNTRTLRWLKRVGFTVSEATVPAGITGEPFHPIMICKESFHV